jgi:coenzyme Q-binding protein COQ10
MKTSNKVIKVNHKAIDLFSIVLDIEKYPEYIPWCTNIEIVDKKKNEITANMIVDYKLFPSQKFTSNVYFNKQTLIIKTKYVQGPLKDLNTTWKFKDLDKNKSKVIFSVDFEFKNFFHQKLTEIFFPLIEKKMIDSFLERANLILN